MESGKKSNSRVLLALICLVAAVAVLFLVWRAVAPQGTQGGKHIVVQVVHGDGSSKEFPVDTEEEFLGKVLVAEGIVEDNQSDYGLYILTADGETADDSAQEWWCITQDGQSLNTGADTTPVVDGAHYELTLTVGYDF